MWLVIRWILLPLAVGRRIHPSIGEFKRFNDQSKDFRKRRGAPAPGVGSPGPQRPGLPTPKNPSNNQPHVAK